MSLIKSLTSPYLVAHFQKLCGLKSVESLNKIDKNSVQKYSYTYNGYTHYILCFGSSLAAENFYYVISGFYAWWVDIYVGRKVVMAIGSAMFLGQALKDILQLPRPKSPPVIRLESLYETEYGMPSTHTVAACIFSASFMYFAKEFYMDLIAGTALSLVTLYSLSNLLDNETDILLQNTQKTVAFSGLLFILSVLLCHPATAHKEWNTARGDTCEILGLTAGFICGSSISVHHGFYPLSFSNILIPNSSGCFARLVARFGIGIAISLPVSCIIKHLCMKIFSAVFSVSIENIEEAKKDHNLEPCYKYFTTFASLLVATTLPPYMFKKLGF